MKRLLVFSILLFQGAIYAQNDPNTVKSQLIDIPGQNLLKYNRSLFNPTFSYVRADQQELTLYSRIQWVDIENSPKTYIFNYTGAVNENTSAGISLFQNDLGIITNFGAIVNAAYGIKLSDEATLTMGVNLTLFRTTLDFEALGNSSNDPELANFEDSFSMIVQPGINLSVGNFDIGIYGENMVDYNLKTSESLTTFDEKTFSAHLMYSHPFEARNGILEDGYLRVAATGLIEGGNNTQIGGSALIDLPDYGWFQAGYNDFYGYAFGAGFKISPELGVGILLEKGTDNLTSLLGPTYEITVNYSFASAKSGRKSSNRGRAPLKKQPVVDNTAKEQAMLKEQDRLRREVDSLKAVKSPTLITETKYEDTEILVLRSIDGVEEGFYLVVNVFSKKYNFNRFLLELAKKGLNPKYFFDSERQYYYVYLEKYVTEDEAENVRLDNYNGKYTDELWVLGVQNKD
jgi:type IX secretion system PorP/SprF family membrane protein